MSGSHEQFQKALVGRHRLGRLFHVACAVSTWGTVAVLILLLGSVAYQASGWLSWSFLTRFDSQDPHKAGIIAGLWGSFWLIFLTGLFTVPVGVGAAVYLEEYARPGLLTRFIQLNIANLAGVPSIVYGILGFSVFVRCFGLVKETYLIHLGFTSVQISFPFGRTVIAGALTLMLLSLPVVIIASQEALRAVPASLRHAALALGATKWQTISQQVLPAALPGILTGVILALSRALGETAPLAVLGVATFITFAPGRIDSLSDLKEQPGRVLQAPFDEFTAIPLQIYNWLNELDRNFQNHVAAAGIVVLLVVLILSNGVAIAIRQRFQRKIRW